MEFLDLLNEEIENFEYKDNVERMEEVIKKIFPDSYVSIFATKMSRPIITGEFALGKDKSEYYNGIIRNDPLFHIFNIHVGDDDIHTLKWLHGNMIDKSYRTVKTGLRDKKLASMSQIEKAVINYFKKLPSKIKANKDKIHDDYLELFKKKKLI